MEEGQRMTNYQRVRKELGTISYNRIIEPNRLEEYALYMKNENEIRAEKEKEVHGSKKGEKKHIKIEEGKKLFDYLEENNKEINKEGETIVKKENKSSEENSDGKYKKKITIVGSLRPDANSSELKL